MTNRRTDADLRRKMSRSTSLAMRRDAENRRCEACDRKSAVSRIDLPDMIVFRCRWCGDETCYPLHL